MRLPIQVQAILYRKVDERLQFLLLRRAPDREGFWQPVTGGQEEGESRAEALDREVREETGIKTIIRVVDGVHYFEYSLPHLIKEYVFGVEVGSDERVAIGKEHSEFRWCSYHEALQLLKWKENKMALSRLNKILNSQD
ncbi:NUDIX pyrophosphatase [Candidatus Bathyarchaeota archaeon]|nr:NUDIX pyrophosphatase [Candidatus Bathyarchaeota archaeon]